MTLAPYFVQEELVAQINELSSEAAGEGNKEYIQDSLAVLNRLVTPSPDLSTPNQEIPREFSVSAKYTEALNSIAREFAFDGKVIYVPGHGCDASHCLAFSAARRIIGVEVNPIHVAHMRAFFGDDKRISSWLGSVSTFVPDEPIDVILVLSNGYKMPYKHFEKILAPNALLICNFRAFKNMPGSDHIASFNGHTIVQEFNEEFHDRQVENDDELKASSTSSRHASYQEVIRCVYNTFGTAQDLVSHYVQLREDAIDKQIQREKLYELRPERAADCAAAGIDIFFRTDAEWEERRSQLRRYTVTSIDGTKLKALPDYHRPTNTFLQVYRYTKPDQLQ